MQLTITISDIQNEHLLKAVVDQIFGANVNGNNVLVSAEAVQKYIELMECSKVKADAGTVFGNASFVND